MTQKNKFGLIGYPLQNSFSVDYFTKKFEENLLSYSYENFPIQTIEELPNLLKEEPHLRGFNVTKPYKEKIIPYLNQLAESAKQCGAVNCVEILEDGKLMGHNTDVYGFKKSLINFIGSAQNLKALIIGNGGASKAVAQALKELQITYKVAARNGRGDLLLRDINEEIISDHDILIQTTPVGMYPLVEETLPFSVKGISKRHYCYDLIYLPAETIFLKLAKEAGAKTQNGLAMLHEQADEAYRIWMNSKT